MQTSKHKPTTGSVAPLLAPVLTFLLGLAMVMFVCNAAMAANSLGLGRPEQAIKPEGIFAPFLFWVQAKQAYFYGLMRTQIEAMHRDGTHVWLLVGLSFVYGIFHAVGPGHGKAVISSYMMANEIAARRGIALSFASSFIQALTAIVVVSAFVLFLRGSGLRQSNTTGVLEIASYGAVMVFGAWLLWTKTLGGGHHHHHGHSEGHDHAHIHDHDHVLEDVHEYGVAPTHDHAHEHNDADHGHLHAPDPAQLKGTFSLRQAGSAILAVGLRPCSGALIVLTFTFLNSLYVAGVASTFAMAVGTGITVASLAALAVWAKDVAVRVGGLNYRAALVHRIVEIGGAAVVFLLGLTLFSASLYF